MSPLPSFSHAEVLKRQKDEADKKAAKDARRARRAAAASGTAAEGGSAEPEVPKTPVAFLFPGQGSQVRRDEAWRGAPDSAKTVRACMLPSACRRDAPSHRGL